MLFASSYICYYVVQSIIAKHNASNYMHQPAPAIFSFDFDLKKKKNPPRVDLNLQPSA